MDTSRIFQMFFFSDILHLFMAVASVAVILSDSYLFVIKPLHKMLCNCGKAPI